MTHIPVGFWTKTDSDVIMQIIEEAANVSLLTRHYVKGHQDTNKDGKALTYHESLNVDADASATKKRYEMTRPQNTVILFPASRVNIFIDYQHISSALDSFLHDRFTAEQHGQYMEQKYPSSYLKQPAFQTTSTGTQIHLRMATHR